MGCLFFSRFMKWNWRPLISKSWHFAVSEDIMTKSKSQGLHIIRIKYWNASGSGSPPSFIPAPWNIGILLHKQATLGKHFLPECTYIHYNIKPPSHNICHFKYILILCIWNYNDNTILQIFANLCRFLQENTSIEAAYKARFHLLYQRGIMAWST